MVERRHTIRYAIWFPVTVEQGGEKAWAVCNDASAGGVLISATSRIELGAEVFVTFRVAPSEPERRMRGRVVRVEGVESDPRAVFPHRIAVEFEDEARELEERFRRASDRPGPRGSSRPPPAS